MAFRGFLVFLCPTIFSGHAYSITPVCMCVCSIHTSSMENGFCSISFDKISVLDSYFIHRYVVVKYRSRSLKGKIHL